MASQAWEEVVETHHLPTPDTVGASMTSEKVRIDTGTIPSDNILLVDKKVETSTLDRQPPEYEDLGIYFSPTSEMNEDILYTLGSFRLDDYIGSPLPSAQSASKYEDLKDIQGIYNKKLRGRYNYWDYIKIIQEFDHTLFKIIEQWVPFKANLKTGLLIEPTYLERNKFQREVPTITDGENILSISNSIGSGRSLTMVPGSYQTINAQIETYNAGNKAFAFAPTLLYRSPPSFYTGSRPNNNQTITSSNDFIDPFATSSNVATITGQWEPGTYVVSNNNFSDKVPTRLDRLKGIGYSKIGSTFKIGMGNFGFETILKIINERLEQGTNGTIEIYEDYMNPFKRLKNHFGALHSNNGQSCQAPIRPIKPNREYYGIGAAAIGSSFVVGNYYLYGGGNRRGVGYSAVQNGFIIQNYIPTVQSGIGSATIGGSFIVGFTQNANPRDPYQYKTHTSNTLLGNIMTGRKSKKYFKYTTYSL